MLRREEGASGKRDQNLQEPGIYPGFPYSRRIPGKSRKRGIRGSGFGKCFPQERGEGAGKRGEKKQSLAPGALQQFPSSFGPILLELPENFREGKFYGSQGGWDQSGADPSAEFPGFSRFSSSLGFLTPAQEDQDGSSSEFLGFLTFSTTKSTYFSFPGLQFILNFSTPSKSHGNDPESSQNPNS